MSCYELSGPLSMMQLQGDVNDPARFGLTHGFGAKDVAMVLEGKFGDACVCAFV